MGDSLEAYTCTISKTHFPQFSTTMFLCYSPHLNSNNLPLHFPSKPIFKHPFNHTPKPHLSFTLQNNPKRRNFLVKSEKETETNSNVGLAVEHETDLESKVSEENEGNDEQKELDWKNDEEFKKFMGNPSIEAAIKLEKKRTDRKLKELDRERKSGNLMDGLFNKVVRDNLYREKQRLEKA